MKKIISILTSLLVCTVAFAQFGSNSITKWTSHVEAAEDADTYRVIFTGKIADGYHTYTMTDEFSATTFEVTGTKDCITVGKPYEISTPKDVVDEFGDPAKHYYDEIILAQNIKITGPAPAITGTIFTNSCTMGACTPEWYDFDIKVDLASAVMPLSADGTDSNVTIDKAEEETSGNLWALIIEAILWGFAMLLTPCVFPMVPMTVSFFMKGSDNVAQGRFKAAMYGLFIVLLYTVPICVIIGITTLFGGNVTADIFNWLSTHWLPNIIFFIVFMVFAASFFGAFEITLPQSLVNKSDRGADKGGLVGVFFMALTLVLVSFSCTGPIVGSVLIKSTQGQFWEPMVTMLAFSIAFALPFTLLAFFPSLLKKFKKSGGGWLNSVKVVLGFYLLGKIRFAHDEPVEHLSVKRLTLAIAVFSFVVYLIPGMWGAPLKALSGYLPPITTQDFVIGQEKSGIENKYGLHLPHELEGYFTLEEGMKAAKAENKPIFVDVTGHGCVNCREMESRVWSDPRVLKMLRNDFVIVALYTDDKQDLMEEDWVKDEATGKVYKEMGRANGYIARTKWNVNAQPNYVLLSPDGEVLVPARGYDLDVEGFIKFLQSGLDAYSK